MGTIKIPTKKAVVSNKNETLPEKPETVTPAEALSAPSLTPFIDKIVIAITPPTAEAAKSIHDAFFTYADDKTLFLGAQRLKTFTIGKRIVLGDGFDTPANPHLMIAHGFGKVNKIRLEFSPADLGLDGMNQLRSALVVFLPDGWDFVLENGLVQKIEVSVDLPKVQMSSLHPLLKQTASAQTWSSGGMLQTLVLGKSKSGAQTRIYDRGAKRKAMGQFSPDYEGTRVERVVRLARPLSKLSELPNQFAHIEFAIAPPPPPSESKPYIWTMFMDSVAARSLPVALKLLPTERRTAYRKWLAKHAVTFWDPDLIWAQWPAYLTSSGLLKKP